jgi:FkbM family methyltransferase
MPDRTVPILPPGSFNELALCRHGPMLFNRHDRYIGASLRRYGEFSPGETRLFAQLVGPGATVVEVGANIGAHTVPLSRMVGPGGAVHAFEPQRLVFQTLCANLALNSCANVHAHHAAVGNADGEIAVPFLPPDQLANFGGLSLLGASSGARVPLRTLDSLGLAACALIKLDLEGMEIEALQGGAALVDRLRPLLYVENDREAQAQVLVALPAVLAPAAPLRARQFRRRAREHLRRGGVDQHAVHSRGTGRQRARAASGVSGVAPGTGNPRRRRRASGHCLAIVGSNTDACDRACRPRPLARG